MGVENRLGSKYWN